MFQRELRDFSTVHRWGTLRTIQRQTLAEHTFYVVIYARDIAQYLGLEREAVLEVMEYAAYHDAEELVTGDPPGPWKRAVYSDKAKIDQLENELVFERFGTSARRDGSSLTRAIVKVADEIDAVMWLAGEMQMGNSGVSGVMADAMARLNAHIGELPVDGSLRVKLRNMVAKARDAHQHSLSNYLMG